MSRFRWLVVLILVGAVGGFAYAIGFPSPVVYVIRGVLRHFAYSRGGR